MAFKPVPKPPQFADLKGILAQTKDTDNPLYQVVEQIIERLTQLKLVTITEERIREIVINNIPIEVPVTPPVGAHAPTHEPGGSDPLHVDAIPTVGSLRTLGTGANQAAPGNDVRFSDARNPLPHGATHNTAGGDPITHIAETIIDDGAILARVAANETITGQYTFNQGITYFNHATAPQIYMVETAAGANNKKWRLLIVGGSFNIQTVDDAESLASNAIQIARVGTQVNALNFYTNGATRTIIDVNGTLIHYNALRLAGRSSIILSGDQTAWNPTGLGTVFFMAVSTSTAGLSIRGILAQSDGYIFTIFNSGVVSYTFTSEDGAASAVNRMTITLAGITISQWQSVTFRYDGTLTRWTAVAIAK